MLSPSVHLWPQSTMNFALFLASDHILSLWGDVSIHFSCFASTCTSTCSVDVNFPPSFTLSVCSHSSCATSLRSYGSWEVSPITSRQLFSYVIFTYSNWTWEHWWQHFPQCLQYLTGNNGLISFPLKKQISPINSRFWKVNILIYSGSLTEK